MYLEDCKVIENVCLCDDYYLMKLSVSENMSKSKAGQFFMLKCSNEIFILRRPISLHYIDREKHEMEFYYEVKGGGTKNLASFKPGEIMNIQGPLGNGFITDIENKKILVVGGGMGIAPMKLLIDELKEKNKVHFIAGGRNKNALKILKNFSFEDTTVVSDDGSVGLKGTVIDAMDELLKDNDFDIVYTCGPHGMMLAVSEKSSENNIQSYLSLEARMACGVKACVGCSIETNHGMKKVCYDGPVFESKTIVDYEPKVVPENTCCGSGGKHND